MIKKLVDNFLIFKSENSGTSDRTIKAYSDVLDRFEKWLAGRDVLTVSSDELLVFTGVYLHKTYNLATKSRVSYIVCIRQSG